MDKSQFVGLALLIVGMGDMLLVWRAPHLFFGRREDTVSPGKTRLMRLAIGSTGTLFILAGLALLAGLAA